MHSAERKSDAVDTDVVAGEQHPLFASLMLLVHFIPRIVNGNSSASLFHSPLSILICTRDVLRQVYVSATHMGSRDLPTWSREDEEEIEEKRIWP